MADDIRKTIPQLDAGGVVSGSLFESAQPAQTSTGYASVKVTSDDIATYTNATKSYSALNTSAKQIIPAINEAASMGGVVQLTQAEYDLLDPAVQADGSIYKITDNAKMYCLGYEYHPVEECTVAEYNQKTSAQQNNGTIYIQTDKETTGSDIPVSDSYSTSIAEALSKFGFDNIKSQIFTGLTVPANNIDTRDLTLTVPADYGILCGFSLAGTSNCSIIQCYFNSKTVLHTRVLNLANQQDSYSFVVFYI